MMTLAAPTQLERVVRHSRFLAQAVPLATEAELAATLQTLTQTPASHHCWAWRLGQRYRSNDDGEPSGTAGRPILAAIDGQQLDRVLVVVTRWFGGVKLGAGGLVRAYGGTAAECLRLAERRALRECLRRRLRCLPADQGVVRHLLQQHGADVQEERWDGHGLQLLIDIDAQQVQALQQALGNATAGRVAALQEG